MPCTQKNTNQQNDNSEAFILWFWTRGYTHTPEAIVRMSWKVAIIELRSFPFQRQFLPDQMHCYVLSPFEIYKEGWVPHELDLTPLDGITGIVYLVHHLSQIVDSRKWTRERNSRQLWLRDKTLHSSPYCSDKIIAPIILTSGAERDCPVHQPTPSSPEHWSLFFRRTSGHFIRVQGRGLSC